MYRNSVRVVVDISITSHLNVMEIVLVIAELLYQAVRPLSLWRFGAPSQGQGDLAKAAWVASSPRIPRTVFPFPPELVDNNGIDR